MKIPHFKSAFAIIDGKHVRVGFTDDHAKGAIPNGTVVVKQNSDSRDPQPDGCPGIVLGSILVAKLIVKGIRRCAYCYFIQWDGSDHPVATMDIKVKKDTRGERPMHRALNGKST